MLLLSRRIGVGHKRDLRVQNVSCMLVRDNFQMYNYNAVKSVRYWKRLQLK